MEVFLERQELKLIKNLMKIVNFSGVEDFLDIHQLKDTLVEQD